MDDIDGRDLSYRVFCNQDIRVQTLTEEGRFLAAFQTDGNVTLLFTVGKKQKFPLCSNVSCSKQTKCICFKRYKKLLQEHEESEDEDSNYYWKSQMLSAIFCRIWLLKIIRNAMGTTDQR